MNEATLMTLLRLVHIISGAVWVGTVFFLAFYIVPIIRESGPASGAQILRGLEKRRFGPYMGVLPGLAILSGIVMYQRALSLTHHAFGRSPMGIALGIGGALALVAAVIGGAVAGRTADALTKFGNTALAAGVAYSPEQTENALRLQAKLAWSSKTVAVLLLLTTALMAAARYL
jgi:uncharacterized membrane protein